MPRKESPRPAPYGPFGSGRRDGVTVRIRVKPAAAQERIRGIVETSAGPAIEVSVTAPPADGSANEAVIAALARDWRMPKSTLSIIAGNKAKVKTILVTGESGETLPRLLNWLRALPLGKDV